MNDKSTMNKIMEYMALGKPIVQFDLTEGRFSAQEASLYAKPNDARDLAEKIVELLDDPERRERMGSSAAAASRTSWPGLTRCRSCSRPTARSGDDGSDQRAERRRNRSFTDCGSHRLSAFRAAGSRS